MLGHSSCVKFASDTNRPQQHLLSLLLQLGYCQVEDLWKLEDSEHDIHMTAVLGTLVTIRVNTSLCH